MCSRLCVFVETVFQELTKIVALMRHSTFARARVGILNTGLFWGLTAFYLGLNIGVFGPKVIRVN